MPAKLNVLFCLIAISVALNAYAEVSTVPQDDEKARSAWRAVAGSGTHFVTAAMIHSVENTSTGVIQRSTDIVELEGDLVGRILYQPVSDINFVEGTLVNTGHQVFSGTILDSEPVLLHDEDFRFDVDLNTGATTGEIFLVDRIAGPKIRCLISMNGTGMTATGDNRFVYQGKCRSRRERDRVEKVICSPGGADSSPPGRLPDRSAIVTCYVIGRPGRIAQGHGQIDTLKFSPA